ncbi:MAG: type II toxin-antitoxin system HipA family toxin [Deltaproteobacteria bacterium]|nr:type II toxin-antitoxin system HipA family toxin [Deltaproteobacteria bacterium]
MAVERRTVEVVADWAGLGGPLRMGLLHATPSRGKEILAFEYDQAWLDSKNALALDPSLRMHQGRQHAPVGRPNFGVFLDSSPDRWGRVLLQRREAQLARDGERRERSLLELDYLLGVYDGHRLGALRFRREGGPFLDDNSELASPPWTSLRELEQASLHLERAGAERDTRYNKWLRMLIAPGRSLGGARPKASVLDAKKRLWIAKLPSANDPDDVGAWESVAHALAMRAGVVVAEGKRARFGRKHHTFLTRRFDRTDDGRRLHFASAMTMLERGDGEPGASYLDLASVLTQQGAHAPRDLQQLWRRIVFFVCISNVDDHLRNHGFLLDRRGWSLAPAYDMNPVAHGEGLTLNISETDNAQDLELALEVAKHFRVKPATARTIIGEVKKAVRRWRVEAKKAGIARSEQDRMANAFRVAEQGTG